MIILGNIFFAFYGISNNYIGAIKTLTIDAIWPIFYLLFSITFCKKHQIKNLLYIFIYSVIFISFYDFNFILQSIGYPALFVDDFLEIDLKFGIVEYTADHIYSLGFCVPLTICLYFLQKKSSVIINNKLVAFSAVLGSVCIILTGKRSLWIILLLNYFFVYIFWIKKKTKIIISVIAFLICLLFINCELADNYIYYFVEGFQFGSNSNTSAGIRKDQFKALIEGWYEAPLIGHGTGSYTKEYIRDDEISWAYELTYILLLFQKGLIGFLLFLFIPTFGILRLYKNNSIEIVYKLPIIIGVISFLLINATNPFLGKFSYIWIMYLPLLMSKKFT